MGLAGLRAPIPDAAQGDQFKMGRDNKGNSEKAGFFANPRLWARSLQHPLTPISGETPGPGSAAPDTRAASSRLSQIPCSHKEKHQLHVGLKCPGGGTSSRQTILMSLWAWFNCFKPEVGPGPKHGAKQPRTCPSCRRA